MRLLNWRSFLRSGLSESRYYLKSRKIVIVKNGMIQNKGEDL